MKILRSSNYDDAFYEPKFVENLPSMNSFNAARICSYLNSIDPAGPHFYKPVENDYVIDWKDPRE